MKIPNADQAIIPKEKLREYLLSPSHPVGKFKAAFFKIMGYTIENWDELETAIRSIVSQDVIQVTHSNFGDKYEVRGEIIGPSGTKAWLVSVWIIRDGDTRPYFVTAYPGE